VLVAEKMDRLSVVILKEDMEAVLETIAERGVMHLAKVEEIDEWADELESADAGRMSSDYLKRHRRIKMLIDEIMPEVSETGAGSNGKVQPVGLSVIDDAVKEIEDIVRPLLSRRRAVSEKLAELRSMAEQIEVFVPSGLPLESLMKSSFLYTAIGTVDVAQQSRLAGILGSIPSVVMPYRHEGRQVHIVCVVLRKDRAEVERCLREVSFKESDLPEDMSKCSSEIESHIAGEIEKHETDLDRVRSEIDGFKNKELPRLFDLLKQVEAALLLIRIRQYCKLTDRTCIFSGWVPRSEGDALIAAVKEVTGGTAIVDVVEAEDLDEVRSGRVEVPVLMKHLGFLRPFQLLVEGYGIPSYRTIDPTLFVAVTFLVMFGTMFGDAGHGLVLFIAGLLVGYRFPAARDVGRLITYGGVSSMVFGVLYGSIFGVETLIPAIWGKPLENVTALFAVAIVFGITMVSLGILLNIANSVRTHSFLENFFNKTGPIGGIIYWSAVGISIKTIMSAEAVPRSAIFLVLGVPIAVFLMQGPILRVMGKRDRAFPEGVTAYVMEQLIETMEMLMGYLANTVSFLRVAAFGLAHAGLFVAVFSLAEVISEAPGGLLLSWLVIVCGNILIILLEGLVVTIQALRLEYYEFFGKFFSGAGSRYQPSGFATGLLKQVE